MSLKAAAWYSSIGEKRLKKLALSGEIDGYQDPGDLREGWIFDRLSIDKYRENSNPSKANEKFILDIVESIE
jgi:hypothetical protein